MRQDLTSALIGARFVRSFLLRLRGTMPGTMRQSLMINLLWKPWPMASSMILDDWPIRNGPFSRSLNVAIVSPILGGRCRSFHISPKHDPSSYFGHIAMTGHVMSCHVTWAYAANFQSKTSLVDWWITAWCMLIPTWVSGGIPIWKRWRIISALYLSGWWLSHPSEKYENQSGWLFPTYGKIKTCSKPPTSYAFVDSPTPFDGSINRLAINHRKETGKLPTLRISSLIFHDFTDHLMI